MKSRILLGGMLVLVAMPVGTRTGERLEMRVSPTVSMAPADLIVQMTIESNASNRALEIVAESDDFYRSSEIPLDGANAPHSPRMSFRSLPGGVYTVRAVLKGANERLLAQTHREVSVVSSGRDR
jgi:hypothetical protein